ncbi:PorP/SprF family type IX secretion system membrane protein [Lentiprolixibacter aurantiacus]|uniref:PorP/SprF family type IX secretion system membrane protein n=1 Tax=Lentiprolixibacter aurantiacus TaxID=2993939 RepID=A0AAE3MJ34_9FLAO|nr:PorP/SprF family type IX secretion system membrane protein [Lentiprolixibacter aurantiacus]MCX2718511.1 PorP/SprF family type IX secretion system membrane protein [Lentiprolixibacter aurantiacus]
MKLRFVYVILCFLALTTTVRAQEESPFISYDVPSQNLLKFNRFLINPTFSTVREDKSYINLLHRNQSVSFDDNNQTYFLSYSGRMNDRTGLGVSLYTQTEGVLRNYGVLANYAYGIKLSDKSNFTFGANFSYYNSGLDLNRVNTVEDDPFISGFQDASLLSFQPGFNLSYGNWDFGLFAENLFDYNLKTSESITDFQDKTFSGHLQYTHQFKNDTGILEGGRLMPLARARKVGQEEFVLGGNLIMDLPKIGWLQGGYDSFYGASAGIGFNLNRRLSIGYTMEKGLSSNFDNFGLTHEISFAYSITPNLTEDRVMLEDDFEDALVNNEDEPEDELTAAQKEAEIEELKRRLAENDEILAELIFRQDSLEQNQQRDLEQRFEMVMRMVRRETQGKRPEIEEKAKELYFNPQAEQALAERQAQQEDKREKALLELKKQKDELVQDYKKEEVVPEITKDRTEIVATKTETTTKKKIKPSVVKSRKFRDLDGVTDGYYVVANVYKGDYYLNKFVDKLNSKGIDADYIDNPNNGMKYVYLKRYDSWKEAKEAYETKMGGAYDGDLWIMNVENRYTNEAYVENTRKLEEKSSRYAKDVLRQNVVVRDNVKEGQEPKTYELKGVGGGYYIIANVFANPKNANRFVKLLNSRGLSASYFINPENNYRYVYLKKHDSWNNALISYYSNLNDAYNDKMWIMRVTPNLIT